MRAARGFTLIEMVVVIAVLGLLMTILVGITRALVSQQRYATTRARMANVDTALAVYVATNKRLPCPADGTKQSFDSTAANFDANAGREAATVALPGPPTTRTCNNGQKYGVVPWVALGLTASDVEDGWGGRFTYRVGPELVNDTAMDFTACDPAGSALVNASPPPFCSASCVSTNLTLCTSPVNALTPGALLGKGLVVENVAGSILMDPRNNPTTGAAYVVISHGPEGGGAYGGNGVMLLSSVSPGSKEANNFADIPWSNPPSSPTSPSVFLVDDSLNGTASTAHFDDIVSRPTILTLAVKVGLGPRAH